MPQDARASVAALRTGKGVLSHFGERLQRFMDAGRLMMDTHWFYPTSLFYFQIPHDLCETLAGFDLVILKGDANYRRLLGDAHWPPTSSFTQATAYFPTPFVSLRTLKAELIVGLREGQAEQLTQQDANWRVNGQRGVIQANILD
jgi:hypothetical protein